MEWLSEQWFAEAIRLSAEQPSVPGASARMQFQLTSGPSGALSYYWVIEDGRLVDAALGKVSDPDVVLTQTYQDALAIHVGELDFAVAFMQGLTKVAGDMGRLLSVMALASSSAQREWQHKLSELAAK